MYRSLTFCHPALPIIWHFAGWASRNVIASASSDGSWLDKSPSPPSSTNTGNRPDSTTDYRFPQCPCLDINTSKTLLGGRHAEKFAGSQGSGFCLHIYRAEVNNPRIYRCLEKLAGVFGMWPSENKSDIRVGTPHHRSGCDNRIDPFIFILLSQVEHEPAGYPCVGAKLFSRVVLRQQWAKFQLHAPFLRGRHTVRQGFAFLPGSGQKLHPPLGIFSHTPYTDNLSNEDDGSASIQRGCRGYGQNPERRGNKLPAVSRGMHQLRCNCDPFNIRKYIRGYFLAAGPIKA